MADEEHVQGRVGAEAQLVDPALKWFLFALFAAISAASGLVTAHLKHWPSFPWQFCVPADILTFTASCYLAFLSKRLLKRETTRWKRYSSWLLIMLPAIAAMFWVRMMGEKALIGKVLDSSNLPFIFGLVFGETLFDKSLARDEAKGA